MLKITERFSDYTLYNVSQLLPNPNVAVEFSSIVADLRNQFYNDYYIIAEDEQMIQFLLQNNIEVTLDESHLIPLIVTSESQALTKISRLLNLNQLAQFTSLYMISSPILISEQRKRLNKRIDYLLRELGFMLKVQ